MSASAPRSVSRLPASARSIPNREFEVDAGSDEGIRHWHSCPGTLPAPQSQKNLLLLLYTTLCPTWHALAHAPQQPLLTVRSHV